MPESGLLVSYPSCGDFLDAVRAEAVSHVGPWGWEGGFAGGFRGAIAEEEFVNGAPADAVAESAAPAPAEAPASEPAPAGLDELSAATGIDFSSTNVQERGIDEPDIVKTDGKTIWVVAQSSLYAIDVTGDEPVLLGRLELEVWGAQLLLAGDRVVVIGQGSFAVPLSHETDLIEPALPEPGIAPYGHNSTTLKLVDVSAPAKLTVVETLSVEGAFIAARLTGESIRLVTSSFPDAVPFVYPGESGFASELAARLENHEIVSTLGARDWLPEYVRENHTTGASESGLAVGCSSVRVPVEPAGLGMLSVLTLDPARGLSPVDSDALMTSAQTVYASTSGLYVATPFWSSQIDTRPGDALFFGGREHTLIHRFDIAEPFETVFTGSGEVLGSLLNQFSVSEHGGHLRVATTDHYEQESYVTVLDTSGDELERVGRVGNLGLGEQIYAVRFIGEIGYVVTFRQIDPLYTLDLANPKRPKVRGELKIPGYSAYLHPIGDGLLLGIGQDATDQGQLRGAQLSLFDVSDLDDPTRLHQMRLGQNSHTEAEYDHHAFLWWPSLNLAVLPISAYHYDQRTGVEEWFSGAVGAEVDRERGIRAVGSLTHPHGSQIRRSVVVGDTLYTVSEAGLKASSLETFAERGWLPLG